MPIFPETPDIKYTYFFLEPTISGSPYGIKFAPSGQPHMLGIFDANSNPVFPQTGYVDWRSMSLDTGAVQAYTAETPGVLTATEPTLALATTYGFSIAQYNPLTKSFTNPPIPIAFNTTTGALTAGTAAAQWANAINLYNKNGNLNCTAANAGAVLSITAATGYPLMILSNSVGGVTFGTTTAGVQSLGNKIDLANGYYTAGTPPLAYSSTGTYNLVALNYSLPLPGSQAGSRVQKYKTLLWVDTTSSQYSAWETYFLSVAQGTISGFAISSLKISS